MPWSVAPSVTAASPVRMPARARRQGIELRAPPRRDRARPGRRARRRPPGDRRAPDRHHGIADELLDRAAVALDHGAGDIEVAAQELAGVLRVTALGRCGEPDEVDEQHRHDPSLGRGGLSGRCRRSDRPALGQPRAALAAELDAWRVRRATRWARRREARPTLGAELASLLVRRRADGTDHGESRLMKADHTPLRLRCLAPRRGRQRYRPCRVLPCAL